jgi:hypothetical protein
MLQVSSLIEIHYAIGAMNGASSNYNALNITNGDVTSPIESLETLGGSTLDCSVSESSMEIVKQSRRSTESLLSSFTLVEADPEALEPESDSLPSPPPDATPVPTEEEEFLANMCGDTDEFGVRLCCLCHGLALGLRELSSADTTSPTSSSARRIAKPLAGLQERRRLWPEVKK